MVPGAQSLTHVKLDRRTDTAELHRCGWISPYACLWAFILCSHSAIHWARWRSDYGELCWSMQGFDEEENLHTLIEVTTDVGVGGIGSVFTSLLLVEGSIQLLSKHLIGESAQEPMRVTEKLHQETFWQ